MDTLFTLCMGTNRGKKEDFLGQCNLSNTIQIPRKPNGLSLIENKNLKKNGKKPPVPESGKYRTETQPLRSPPPSGNECLFIFIYGVLKVRIHTCAHKACVYSCEHTHVHTHIHTRGAHTDIYSHTYSHKHIKVREKKYLMIEGGRMSKY